MRKGKGFQFYMLLLAVVLLLTAFPAWAENEEPLTLTVEADPDCLLSEAGDMTFFRFTLKNTLEEDYVLDALTLQGDLLEEPKLIAEEIRRFFADENLRVLCVNSIKAEKERLSWKTFAKRLIDFTDNLYKHQ